MDIPSLPPTEFPGPLSIKRSEAWLIAHPEISTHPLGPFAFWNDQVAKWDAKSKRSLKNAQNWMIVALSVLALSFVVQVVAIIMKARGL